MYNQFFESLKVNLNFIHGVEILVILSVILFFVYIFYQLDLFRKD